MKKLVAFTSVVIVSLGATMTIATHNQSEPLQTQGLTDIVMIETKEIMTNQETVVDYPSISLDEEQKANSISNQEMNESELTDRPVDKSSVPVQNTNSSSADAAEKVPTVTQEKENDYLSTVEQLIFERVNQERENAGVSPLSYNQTMQKYARIKSVDMGNRGYFSHENPEGQLMTVSMQQDGVSYSAWGENIAYIGGVSGAESLASQFMTNWMNSEGHRANILSTNFTSIGIGVYEANGKVYATQEFHR